MKPDTKELEQEVMDAMHKVAYWLYERSGQEYVLDLGDLLELPTAYCLPCEWVSPYCDDACLVCGTSYEPDIQNEHWLKQPI
jgi:hypothetical protein